MLISIYWKQFEIAQLQIYIWVFTIQAGDTEILERARNLEKSNRKIETFDAKSAITWNGS